MPAAGAHTTWVFPTRVGVNRVMIFGADRGGGIPHACGGEPYAPSLGIAYYRRIPHACGGEPFAQAAEWTRVHVFPTRVGVNRRCGG